jgi:hypothetical protein
VFEASVRAQDVQGVPAPRREPAGGAEPGARPGAAPDQVLVPEPPHPDEGTPNFPCEVLPCSISIFSLSSRFCLRIRACECWCSIQAQHERADNCFLRAENDKIRCENITMREALKNVICPNCGGPPVAEDFFDEQKLRMENARLKEEVVINHSFIRD